jgi:ABC-type dipeptide/oligopeptide/nickel transport system ATPase component
MNDSSNIEKTILQIRDLSVDFSTEEHIVRAVDNINISIKEGESVGIVGESGSGKTVTALSVLKLIPTPPGIYRSGEINFHSTQFGVTDLLKRT